MYVIEKKITIFRRCKIEFIDDKNQIKTYVFTNFRANIYQVSYAINLIITFLNIYSKIREYISYFYIIQEACFEKKFVHNY